MPESKASNTKAANAPAVAADKAKEAGASAKQTAASATETSSNQSSVSRVLSIPIVAETIDTIDSTLRSNSLTAAGLKQVEGAAGFVQSQAKPITDRFAGPINQVDRVANAALDAVQHRVPYVFEAKTDDVVGRARQPADAAINRGRAVVDGVQTRLTTSQTQLHQLQDRLAQAVRDPKSVQDHVRSLLDQFSAELEKVSQTLAERRKELPQQAHEALGPLFDRFQNAYGAVRSEIQRTDVPLTVRASNVLNVSRDQATPIVRDIIEQIRTFLSKAEKKGAESINGAKDTANDVTNQASGKVNEAKVSAAATAQKGVNTANNVKNEAISATNTNGKKK